MPGITTHFWGWDEPVLSKAIAELTRGWSGGELNLGHTAIIVPGMESSRRLRESLAQAAGTKGGAVSVPHVWHPETALLTGWDGGEIATRLEERVAWMQVMMGIELAEFAALFPVRPAIAGSTWASSVAELLASLRRTLGGGGHDLAAVARLLRGHEDAARWNDLARLEQLYLARLRKLGRADAQDVKRGSAARPSLPEGVREVLVLAAPDLTALMRDWLRNVARTHPVRVFVQAPEGKCAAFDELGAPLAGAWSDSSTRHPPLENHMLRLASTPGEQAREAVRALREFAQAGISAAVGACCPELNSHLESELAAEGVSAYDPAGRLAGQHALVDTLRAWLALCESRAWKPFSAWVRRDDVLTALAASHTVQPTVLLAQLDEIHADRMPATLDDAAAYCAAEGKTRVSAVLGDVVNQLDAWDGGGSAALLRQLLQWHYGRREFNTEHEHDHGLVELVGEIMETALSLDAALGGEALESAAWLGLLLREVGQIKLADRRGQTDLVLHGWLELLWEPARGLVIAGFNDEHVPGAVTPDPFLPDPLRKTLGLACAESRRARDAFLLTAVASQRIHQGNLRLVVGRVSDNGDVLRPSRLLFACDDAALLARVDALFPKSEGMVQAAPRPPRSVAWQLLPPRPQVPFPLKQVSASLLSAYLKCPLRCYFSHMLGMGEVRSGQRELGGDAFGRLVHEVWRRFALEPDLRNSVDADRMADFLADTADAVARERYGPRPLFAVTMQIESAKQRLRALAATQQKLRQEGWIIEHAELVVKPEDGLTIDGVPFKGQIDRIDRHEGTGALRVWDYKTGREGDAEKDHLETVKLEAGAGQDVTWRAWRVEPDEAVVWQNLQLPLYVWAIRQRHPGVSVEAGYLHLPAVVSAAGDKVWSAFDETMMRSGLACAEEAVRRIKAGRFEPADEVAFDEWEELFMGDAAESVAEIARWREETE